MDTIWNKYRRNSKGWQKDDIAKLHPRVILGPAFRLTPAFMQFYNITHVINCAEDDVSPKWFKTKFPANYMCIGAIDATDQNITEHYSTFRETMDDFLGDSECKTVYVHCECGINRSAFLCFLYMCLKFKYPVETAMKAILIQRPCAMTNPSFRKQSLDYIKKHE